MMAPVEVLGFFFFPRAYMGKRRCRKKRRKHLDKSSFLSFQIPFFSVSLSLSLFTSRGKERKKNRSKFTSERINPGDFLFSGKAAAAVVATG